MEKIKKEPSREKENLVFPFPRTYKNERKKRAKTTETTMGGTRTGALLARGMSGSGSYRQSTPGKSIIGSPA